MVRHRGGNVLAPASASSSAGEEAGWSPGIAGPPPGGWVDVDLDALAANYRLLAAAAAPGECGATVKADAYGLGLEPVVRTLWREGCRVFFVANLDEGLKLRAVLPSARVFVFNGVRCGEADLMAAQGLLPVLNSHEQFGEWQRQARRGRSDRPLACALHLDTGMNRLGFGAEDLQALAGTPNWRDGLDIALVMTHLATAHRERDAFTRRQVGLFQRLREMLPADVPVSIGNSAGTLLGPATRGDLVRPGIALFGGNPFAGGVPHPDLREVVRVSGRIVQRRTVGLQGSVGYGGDYTAAPGARLATVGVGYADGYRRVLGNRAHAVLAGYQVPVVGRVSMDLLTIDVTSVPEEVVSGAPGTVTLLGGGIALEALAEAADTIPYELLTGLGPRLPRRYRGGRDTVSPPEGGDTA